MIAHTRAIVAIQLCGQMAIPDNGSPPVRTMALQGTRNLRMRATARIRLRIIQVSNFPRLTCYLVISK